MPKVFAQNFNLTIDDNLYDLVNNKKTIYLQQ